MISRLIGNFFDDLIFLLIEIFDLHAKHSGSVTNRLINKQNILKMATAIVCNINHIDVGQ